MEANTELVTKASDLFEVILPLPSRSSQYSRPLRCALMRPLTFLPLRLNSTSVGAFMPAQSHESFQWYWKWLTMLPVSGLIARTEARYRLSPGRSSPTHAPVDDVVLGVVVAGHPHGAATVLPGVLPLPVLRPGLEAGLTGTRHGVTRPGQLAGLGVECLEEAAHAELAAGRADQHLALDDQRRRGDVGAVLFPVAALGAPQQLAGLGVERADHAVDAADIDLVAVQGDAAVRAVQRAQALGHFAHELPQQLAGLGVVGDDLVVRRGDEHVLAVDDGGRLVARVDAGGGRPHRAQPLDVGRRDLLQRGVAPARVVALGQQP